MIRLKTIWTLTVQRYLNDPFIILPIFVLYLLFKFQQPSPVYSAINHGIIHRTHLAKSSRKLVAIKSRSKSGLNLNRKILISFSIHRITISNLYNKSKHSKITVYTLTKLSQLVEQFVQSISFCSLATIWLSTALSDLFHNKHFSRN